MPTFGTQFFMIGTSFFSVPKAIIATPLKCFFTADPQLKISTSKFRDEPNLEKNEKIWKVQSGEQIVLWGVPQSTLMVKFSDRVSPAFFWSISDGRVSCSLASEWAANKPTYGYLLLFGDCFFLKWVIVLSTIYLKMTTMKKPVEKIPNRNICIQWVFWGGGNPLGVPHLPLGFRPSTRQKLIVSTMPWKKRKHWSAGAHVSCYGWESPTTNLSTTSGWFQDIKKW